MFFSKNLLQVQEEFGTYGIIVNLYKSSNFTEFEVAPGDEYAVIQVPDCIFVQITSEEPLENVVIKVKVHTHF